MQIDFYEEFPQKKRNLEKLRLVTFPSTIFIAAKSVNEFEKYSNQAKKINKKIKVAYWPIIENSYWISGFSNTKDLEKIFDELKKTKHTLLIDLELPLLNKKLFFKNIFLMRKNKRITEEFLRENNNNTITVTYPHALLHKKLARFLGLDFKIKTKKSFMLYSSMKGSINEKKEKKMRQKITELKNKKTIIPSLGTIAKGVFNEPILLPSGLEKDLKDAEKEGFERVIIYRLGGLNKKYIESINRFVKQLN